MNLLEILGQFIGIFVELIPRFARRPSSTEWLVIDSFLFGVSVAKSRPVLHVPVLDTVEYWPKSEEPVNTEMQSLTTSEGESVTVDSGFSYVIADPLKARSILAENYVTKAVMVTRGSIRDHVCSYSFEELSAMDENSDAIQIVRESINKGLSEYGLKLTYFCIEDLCMTKNIRHFGITVMNSNFTTADG